jgi:hypothetical protein
VAKRPTPVGLIVDHLHAALDAVGAPVSQPEDYETDWLESEAHGAERPGEYERGGLDDD